MRRPTYRRGRGRWVYRRSMDNVSPGVPTGLILTPGDRIIQADWDTSPDADFDHYQYRVCAVPAILTGLVITPGDSSVHVEWDASPSFDTGWYYEWQIVTDVANGSGTGTSVDYSPLDNGTVYGIKVRVVSSDGLASPWLEDVFTPAAAPTWSLLTNVSGIGDSDSISPTDAVDTTGVDLFVIALTGSTNSFFFGLHPTDSAGNTWIPLTKQGPDPTSLPIQSRLFYCVDPTTSSSHTFASDVHGSSYPAMSVMGFSGASSSPFDAESGDAQASITEIEPGIIAPMISGELFVTALALRHNSVVTIDSDFTILADIPAAGPNYGLTTAYLFSADSGGVGPTWTAVDGLDLATTMASFEGGS